MGRMASTDSLDSSHSLDIDLTGYSVHHEPTAPYCPSPRESGCYYYGIYSSPRLVARSSTHLWVEPWGPEAYLIPKQLSPLGSHALQAVWEEVIGPMMISYLDSNKLYYSSLDPVRIGDFNDPYPPAIIWVGVLPDSLTTEDGLKVATHLRGILTDHGIDIHVEIRESKVTRSAKLYEPVYTFDPTAQVREPFSTAVGLSISAAATPTIGGTGGFYMLDSNHPGKIYLVTNRHVVFCSNEEPNEFYKYTDCTQSRKNILLFSEPAVEKYITAIKSEMSCNGFRIGYQKRRLAWINSLGDKDATIVERESLQKDAELKLEKAKKAVGPLKQFFVEVSKDWREQSDRVIGHVVVSPSIGFNVGDDGFTEDWAVIELDNSKFDSTNFIGNAIDLGTSIPVSEFCNWIDPCFLFRYPFRRLLKFDGFIPEEEMYKHSSKTKEPNTYPVIRVTKNGQASGLTVGCLNTIRSFTRQYIEKDMDAQMISKEISVLPRDYESRPFSEPGDSGSSVIDAQGRFAGLLTGGAGDTKMFDISYLTSANFLHTRMTLYGLRPNFFPIPMVSSTV